MTKKQSRRTQRALERELFGPEPKPIRRHRKRERKSTAIELRCTPGNCWACGNCCWPAYEAWTCTVCGVTYPVVEEELLDAAADRALGSPS